MLAWERERIVERDQAIDIRNQEILDLKQTVKKLEYQADDEDDGVRKIISKVSNYKQKIE
jgi:hypothetical protein